MMRKVTSATAIAGQKHADLLVDALVGHEPVGIDAPLSALRTPQSGSARWRQLSKRHWSRKGWNSAK